MRWKRTFTVVGCHAEGEVGRVVTGGLPPIPGETMFDKKRYMERHLDDLRKLILFEPRGAAAVCANVVVPSNNPKADMGFIILESVEYPPMSGSNTICTATVLLETGMLPMTEPVTTLTLEAPGGLVTVECRCKAGKVTSVKFTNVPAFALYLDTHVEVAGVGRVKLDVAYGGMMYALVDAASFGFALTPDEARDICVLGQKVKAACVEQLEVVHPENPEIRDVTIFEMRGPVRKAGKGLKARNTVVVSPGRLDRSPCGTGTSARLAVMHAKRQIATGQPFVHESIIGSRFDARVLGTTRVKGRPAVITSVAGQAWITGIGQYGLDPTDPFPAGYTLSDTWLEAL